MGSVKNVTKLDKNVLSHDEVCYGLVKGVLWPIDSNIGYVIVYPGLAVL